MTPDLVSDLSRLIAFPTVSNQPVDELCAYVARRLEGLGFAVELVPCPHEARKYNLVATMGPPGTDGLVLSGHLDVVPTEGQPWTSDPFELTERGGRLYGRGTADMKGFLAVVLKALHGMPLSKLKRELVLIWTHDEEVGCVGSGHLAESMKDRDVPLPRACLIGEPTDFHVFRMHPGHVRFEIEVKGEAAHSSRPQLGRNAIETAADAVVLMRQLARQLRRELVPDLPIADPWVPLNVGLIQGGSAVNIVPDTCKVTVGYRPLPGMEALAVFERARAMIAAELSTSDCDITLTSGTVTPAMLTPDHTGLAHLLCPHATPGPQAAPFATDGGNLAKLGMQPLVFGPGSIDVAHKADEYVEFQALQRAVGIVRDVIHQRCFADL
jgi:acetylornithine deacetylase